MVAKSGLAAMNAASSLELGLWISNSSALNVPGGTATDTCCAMSALPSGSDTSTGPVSNSSQSPFPSITSQVATSDRLSSTLRTTSWALRTMTESLPSTMSVLSPAAVTLGAGAAPESAALGAGATALRAVSEKLTVPIVESEHAATTNRSASATSFTIFILLPGCVDQGANSRAEGGKRCAGCWMSWGEAAPHDV